MTKEMEMVAKALIGIAKKHNKFYCWVSQATLQLLLVKYQHWNMSERTLRRRIWDLGDQGYIEVVHRTIPDGNGGKRFNCNLYKFKRKLFEWFEKLERVARKVFSFFRRPKLADYSSLTEKRDLKNVPPTVEFWWNPDEKGGASPLLGSVLP